jgi:predicted ATPase
METVYLLQEQYGGFFLRPDLGDKGFNLLMFWGAPTSHENDVDRALNFLLELSSRTGITLRAGISYRLAYTGFIGSSHREDYTAYGWGVTLAARMMVRAGMGEYWMDEETARRAAKHFNVKPLGEYAFKGFKREQKVFGLVGRKDLIETVYQGQFVGRDAELAALAEFVEPLKRGKFAGAMILKGEAGIGKSRLTHSFQTSAYFSNFPVYWAVCQADEILRLPFNPFADWLRKRFELVEGQPEKSSRARFTRTLQQLIDSTPDAELAAELTRTSSVLAALVSISMPGSLYESLDAMGRYGNTLIALNVLLRAESLQKPLILFVEDIHWLDDDTGAFLSYFVKGILAEPEKQSPIAIIVTQRPEGDSPWAADEIPAREIHLDKLASGDLSQLAADILSHPISDSLLALLDSRAEGNPFFAEQILRYLLEQNTLVLDADGKYIAEAGAEISLPTDVRSVLVARLDRLSQQVKEMVQTASVLGREFEVRVLGEMLRADREFSSHLVQAEHADIWSALSEIAYIFRHALLRDAAYSMQLQARQRELHGLAVSAMETIYATNLESHYGELAYHAEKAELTEQALRYLTLAGKLALSVYQNQQAVDYFTRAIAILPVQDLRTRFDLLIFRVEGYYNLSSHEEQARDLDVLENLASQLKDDGMLARAYMRRAYYFIALSDFQNALKYALLSKDLSETARDVEVLLALFTILPGALLRLGRISEAMQYATDGLAFAQNVKHRRGEGNILSLLGLVSLEKEGADVAVHHHEQALLIGREIKDKYLEAMALSNLATSMATSQGDYSTALEYYEQAYSIARELGNGKGQAITLSNIGWLYGVLGNYPAAVNYLQQGLLVIKRIGDRSEKINTCANLSAAAIGQGIAHDAIIWAEESLSLSLKLGDRPGNAWAYFYLGYAHLLDDQLNTALQSFSKCIEIRSEISVPVLVAEARAGLIDVYLKMNNPTLAQIEMEQVLGYMDVDQTFQGAEEPLRILWTTYQALEETKDPRAATVLQNAIQLLNAQISKLRSEDARRMYIENVPWRRAIRQTAKKLRLLD